jgi:hypothetical protein
MDYSHEQLKTASTQRILSYAKQQTRRKMEFIYE